MRARNLNYTRAPWRAVNAPNGHTYILDRHDAQIARVGGENMLADDSSAADNASILAEAPAMFDILQALIYRADGMHDIVQSTIDRANALMARIDKGAQR
jgi:hypothetical protein